MPNPQLNPDALRRAADAVSELYTDGHCPKAEDAAEVAVSAYLATALPEVANVESIPAKMRMLMWEGGEVEVGEIPDGFVLVGFEMETDRAWSMADKATINIERPEVKP